MLTTLTALACAGVSSLRPLSAEAAKSAGSGAAGSRAPRRITDLIGANGWPSSAADIAMWQKMGISWGRGSVGPGQPDSSVQPMRVDKTGNSYDGDLQSVILRNNQNGIRSLLFLGYTPKWNASVPGDSKSAPQDVSAWERYVEAVVRKYSAAPYNVRHFQVWNEAAGRLSGGLPQATFWHGPNFNKDQHHSGAYEAAMQDYVERIHIPAARIIRRYGAYVVYGGWPDQGGLDNLDKWLDYKSPRLNARMADWVDYIDTHYLPVSHLDGLYTRYVQRGPARGLWQTEIGDRYMIDEHFLPRYFFDFAVWALARNWDDPDKYVSMVYHWDGYEPFRLTHRGPPARTFNVSGQSLIVLNQTAPGALSPLPQPLHFGPDAEGAGLLSNRDVVIQVSATSGWRTVQAAGIAQPSGGGQVMFVDALTGQAAPKEDATLNWNDDGMNLRFRVPDNVNGADRKTPRHLAYLVVRAGQGKSA